MVLRRKVVGRGQKFCSRACANKHNARMSQRPQVLAPLCLCGCGGRPIKATSLWVSGHNPRTPPPARRGPANPLWRGGAKRPHDSTEYREWRLKIFDRDDYTCQGCRRRCGAGVKVILNAHHIVPISVDKTKAFDLSNGLTLCLECHRNQHWGSDRKRSAGRTPKQNP